eukprot:TRINITY_DN3642_c0_g1_i8.p1 TRINITY_DN3642_c0_g1~~TRINITY_DN3642_c0_g1_i8.p1  ORF type:complete len:114 (-),score=29.81 TRINITY_DN3642_c0_g1_i8:100-441(-)
MGSHKEAAQMKTTFIVLLVVCSAAIIKTKHVIIETVDKDSEEDANIVDDANKTNDYGFQARGMRLHGNSKETDASDGNEEGQCLEGSIIHKAICRAMSLAKNVLNKNNKQQNK